MMKIALNTTRFLAAQQSACIVLCLHCLMQSQLSCVVVPQQMHHPQQHAAVSSQHKTDIRINPESATASEAIVAKI